MKPRRSSQGLDAATRRALLLSALAGLTLACSEAAPTAIAGAETAGPNSASTTAGTGGAGSGGPATTGGSGASQGGSGGAGVAITHAGGGATATVPSGGAGGSGGSAGQAPTQAGPGGGSNVGGGSATCQGHGYAWCDDFEAAEVDTQRWSVSGEGAKIVSEHAARGAHALGLAFTPGKNAPVLELKQLPNALRKHHFGRFFAWSQEDFPAVRSPGDNYDTYQHVEFFRAKSAASDDYMGYAVGVVGALRLTSPNDKNVDIGKFAKQTPMCIEWEFDATQRYAYGWLNAGGAEQSGQTAKGDANWTLPMNEFDRAYFGLVVITDTTPAMHVWLDELVLDTHRVGCQ